MLALISCYYLFKFLFIKIICYFVRSYIIGCLILKVGVNNGKAVSLSKSKFFAKYLFKTH